jgi:nitroimidazol reductase NimA-like FMN-containing flavoprotein (pyridoxamine 5'-phosphate oxidase superfamily)
MTTTVLPASEPAEPMAKRPRIRELTPRQAEFVLARNCVARIAFLRDGRIEVLPVHYAYLEGAIVGRIALGGKYISWLVASEVVIEVDEVHALYDWSSVVMRGKITLLRPTGSDAERVAYRRAKDAIGILIPGAFTARDPTPERKFLFRVDRTELTGREATTK